VKGSIYYIRNGGRHHRVCFCLLFLSRRSPTLWHRAVPIHTSVFLFIVRGHSPSPAHVRFIICNAAIAIVTLPGSFIRRSTRGWVQLSVPPLFWVSSRLLTATSTAATFARAWSSPFKARGIDARHRYSYTCTSISVLFSARQRHSNHYPYSEPANRKVILYGLAHHYMYGVVCRSFHSTLTATGTRVPTSFLLYS
jgi:hypothetical protein